jgi:hypothetical protein
MAATVTVRRWTGAGPTKTDITSTTNRASTSDAASPGTSNPIPVPPSGSTYSYWVTTTLSADSSPAGTIDNVNWYTDGANGFGTGVTCVGIDADTYVQATGTTGTTGTQLTTGNHAGLSGSPGDVFSYTSGSPLAIAGSIDNPATGDFADFLVYQIVVGATAGPGATPTETFTWVYDET